MLSLYPVTIPETFDVERRYDGGLSIGTLTLQGLHVTYYSSWKIAGNRRTLGDRDIASSQSLSNLPACQPANANHK